MYERALRKVLLIQAIEETDRTGEALPLPDRSDATRKVMGNNPPNVETQAGAPLSSATEWFLLRRAEVLLEGLRARSPGIDHVLAVAGGATSLDRGMLVLACALGAVLAFSEGVRGGINIFAPPLLLLLAWNLLIYVIRGISFSKSRIETTTFGGGASRTSVGGGGAGPATTGVGGAGPGPATTGVGIPNAGSAGTGIGAPGGGSAAAGSWAPGAPKVGSTAASGAPGSGSTVAGGGPTSPGSATTAGSTIVGFGGGGGVSLVQPSWFGRFYARWVRRQIDSLLGHSTRFNAPLAPGLRRFASDWLDLAQPLLFARARRLLHLSAAFAALGLVAAYYVRGFVLRSAAGWEGTGAIGPQTAHALLTVLYGPASLLLGIPVPDADDLAKLRWSAPSLSGVGEPASWLHLIALTAGLYIILPRLILVVLCGLRLWRLSRRLVLPSSVVAYVQTLVATARSGT